MEMELFGYSNGRNILHKLLDDNNLQMMKKILEDNANSNIELLNNRDINGNTAFSYACYNGNLEAVKILLEFKPDVNDANGNKNTPLNNACFGISEDHIEIIKLLLKDDSVIKNSLNKPNKRNITPLMVSVIQENF